MTLAVCAACTKAPTQTPDRPQITPNVELIDVTLASSALDRTVVYRVIQPKAIAAGETLPVVYLLHGGGGSYRDWSNYSDISRFAEKGFILIMPEGRDSYWVNAADRPNDRYEDFVINELVVDVERRYPAGRDRAHRAIVGVSMGGFGAVTLGLKHPDKFAFVGGISSALDVPTRPFNIKRWRQWRYHASIFGPWNSEHRRSNDPFHLLRMTPTKQLPYFFLTCGDQEGLLPANEQFAALLRQKNIPSEFHNVHGGHTWDQWDQQIPALTQSILDHVQHQ